MMKIGNTYYVYNKETLLEECAYPTVVDSTKYVVNVS